MVFRELNPYPCDHVLFCRGVPLPILGFFGEEAIPGSRRTGISCIHDFSKCADSTSPPSEASRQHPLRGDEHLLGSEGPKKGRNATLYPGHDHRSPPANLTILIIRAASGVDVDLEFVACLIHPVLPFPGSRAPEQQHGLSTCLTSL